MLKSGFRANRKSGFNALFLCIIITLLFFSCSKEKSDQGAKKPALPVLIENVVRKTVPVQLSAIGNVEAFSTVSVKSQIVGELLRVHFREGQDVKKGDILFTIDTRTFEAQVKQAEAILARDTAQLENAKEEARRYLELVSRGYVAKEQYEQYRTKAAALDATVNADKAFLENARLQLSYCTIHAPVSGRTGSLAVHEGNLIKANADSPMVVINQIQPIHVVFSVREQDLSGIKRSMKSGRLPVEAFASKEDRTSFHGTVNFVDNAVNPATGMIMLKAVFDNKEQTLWPGQFVIVRLTLTTINDAVVISSSAVQAGQQGQFVFVVKDDQTVEVRQISTGLTFQDIVMVNTGLSPGERIVTDGQMRLTPGAKVEIKDAQGAKGEGQGEKAK